MKKTYLQHQSNSFTDIKIIKMRSKLGIESYGIFWALLELLFNEENKLCIDDYSVLAFSLQCDADKLKSVIEDFDLFIIEDGCFYSKRLNEHIDTINSKSIKAKENASKRWKNANAMPSHSEPNASIVYKSIEEKSIKDKSKVNKRIVEFIAAAWLPLRIQFCNPNCRTESPYRSELVNCAGISSRYINTRAIHDFIGRNISRIKQNSLKLEVHIWTKRINKLNSSFVPLHTAGIIKRFI